MRAFGIKWTLLLSNWKITENTHLIFLDRPAMPKKENEETAAPRHGATEKLHHTETK